MPIDLTQTETLKERTVEHRAVVRRRAVLHAVRRSLLASQATTGRIEDYALAHVRVRLTPKALVCEATDRIRFARAAAPVLRAARQDGAEPEGFIPASVGPSLLAYLRDARLPKTLIVVLKDRGVELRLPASASQVFKPRQFASEHRNVLRYPPLDAFVPPRRAAVTRVALATAPLVKLLQETYTVIRRLNPEDAYNAGVLEVLGSGRLNLLVGEVPIGSMPATVEVMGSATRRSREVNVKLLLDWLQVVKSAPTVALAFNAGTAPLRLDVPGAMYVLAPLTCSAVD